MQTKMQNWLAWPLEHYPISLLIIGILFVLGIMGMYEMPKDEFPQVTIRQGVVVAVYPGATSEESQRLCATNEYPGLQPQHPCGGGTIQGLRPGTGGRTCRRKARTH